VNIYQLLQGSWDRLPWLWNPYS